MNINNMNSSNVNNIGSGISTNKVPLSFFNPYNLIVFLSFFSPIILASSFAFSSFVFQNFKGLIYLGFLIGVCLIRNFIYMLSGAKSMDYDNTICNSVQYSKYGNPTISAFIFAFTIMYISLPMFINGGVNFWVLTGLTTYGLVDIFVKTYKKCIVKTSELLLNILLGLASSALIVTLMYTGGSSKFLFFNEVSSNKEVCSMPKNQTFKCSVYKNGELVGNI